MEQEQFGPNLFRDSSSSGMLVENKDMINMSEDVPKTNDPVQNLGCQFMKYGDHKNRTDLTKNNMDISDDSEPTTTAVHGEDNQKA